MTMEADLTALLKTVSARVFPDFAPSGTAVPWVTYQHIGGQPFRYTDGSAANIRHTTLQINVWAGSRQAALALMRQIEDAICNPAATPFVAQPMAEPMSLVDDDGPLYGCTQDFSIFSGR